MVRVLQGGILMKRVRTFNESVGSTELYTFCLSILPQVHEARG